MMAYARFFADDVYIFASPKGVTCQMCSFGDMLETSFLAESTQEMVDHLKAHQKKGDRMPSTIFDELWADDAENYPTKKA
jgi:hypothetical protein